MIPGPHRNKGARAIGATLPGMEGPFGTRPADNDDQEQEDNPMASFTNDRIAQQIAAATARRAAARQRRARLNRARQAGLAKRHAQKLRRIAERGQQLAPTLNPDQPDRQTDPTPDHPDTSPGTPPMT